MKRQLVVWAWVLLLLVVGCRPSTLPSPAAPSPSVPPETVVEFTIVPTGSVTEESPLRPGIDCGWNWATHEAPEVQAQVDAALQDAALSGVNVHVLIFGEDCLDESGKAVAFATLETDFVVIIEVSDLTDREQIGDRLADVLIVLAQFGPEATPGPQAGRITVTVQSESESQILNLGVATAIEAVEKSLRGEELLMFLEGPTF